jgi:hypothetical protein
MAVFVWSALIGIPVLLFHLSNMSLDVGQHLHAAVMFVASQFLVFWLAARSQPKTRPKPPPRHPIPKLTSPFAASEPEIWNAEIVPTAAAASSEPRHGLAKLIIGNYVASSRPRIVYIEPGGIQRTLQPGLELQIIANSQDSLPTIHIVESDLATQVYVEGIQTSIQVSELNGSGYERSMIP